MAHRLLATTLALIATTAALVPQAAYGVDTTDATDTAAATTALAPSDDAARRNAFDIFNAVHSAMRQWGSSLNHNGMSLFLATVPKGQLFYHGGNEPNRTTGVDGTGIEWLAFEVEHAHMFARSWDQHNRPGPPGGEPGKRPPREEPGGGPGGEPGDGPGGGPGEGPPGAMPTASANIREAAQHWDAWSQRHGVRRRALAITDDQKPLTSHMDGDDNDGDNDRKPSGPDFSRSMRGYFYTYRANRPLNLLYIDGMGAGKSAYGTLDTQDYLLLNWNDNDDEGGGGGGGGGGRNPMFNEWARAKDLCALAQSWAWADGRIDGFVRTEAGFEIIYCDFGVDGGLDVVDIASSPFRNESGGLPVFSDAEFLRGVSQRYHGQPSGRIAVDWSSMVSAFFFDVNLTNPDTTRPELPRLASAAPAERQAMRAHLRDVVAARRGGGRPDKGPASPTIDWQGVVDLVVTRYARRLNQLVRGPVAATADAAAGMLPALLNPFIHYADATEPRARQVARCAHHYLTDARARRADWTSADRSLDIAVETVTHTICTALFDIRDVLYNGTATAAVTTAPAGAIGNMDSDSDSNSDHNARVRAITADLVNTLRWTTWRECDPCVQPDELCLVAMFPWGSAEDHFHPSCQRTDNLWTRTGYWRMGFA